MPYQLPSRDKGRGAPITTGIPLVACLAAKAAGVPHVTIKSTGRTRGVSLPDASRASDRKDSTPRHGRLLHPSSWAERDDRDHAADNFFQGGSPKTGYPTSSPGPPSPPEIVLRQVSGGGAWMNFRFSRALPPGGLAHARRDDLEAFRSGLGRAESGTTYLPTRCRFRPYHRAKKRPGRRSGRPGFTSPKGRGYPLRWFRR